MKKIFIACFLFSLLYTSYSILPRSVFAQDAPNINVTKRRPDRPTNYSPAPTLSTPVAPLPPEVQQVQTTKSSFLSDLWARIKAFFAGIVL